MATALPTCPLPSTSQPFLRDFGGELVPFLGGPEQRINRLGTRLGCRYVMPEMDADEAQEFVVALLLGRQAGGVIMPWPKTTFDPGTPPAPRISATSNGSAMQVGGLGSGYSVKKGQPMSVIHGGRRYMHLATGAVTANGSGVANVGIFPPTRTAYAVNDVVEVANPMIEGKVSPGEELTWQNMLELDVAISFSVIESR